MYRPWRQLVGQLTVSAVPAAPSDRHHPVARTPDSIKAVPSRRQSAALLILTLAALTAGCGTNAQPEGFREGRSIYGDLCSVCHGAAGKGQVGPSLDRVLETWPQCSEHVEWISLGSDGWRAEHGDVYGATETPVEGGMPPHRDRLTVEELEVGAAFERAQYGGLDPETALRQCQAD
jgi:mono/diheme cytochrome c family protein